MSDNHPAARPGFNHPSFAPPTEITPSFNIAPPAPDNTPSPPPPPAPVDRRDSSSGVRQSDVDSMIAAARAKGDPQYIARLIEAARADGWSVPEQPGTVERIVKQPQDAGSYQA